MTAGDQLYTGTINNGISYAQDHWLDLNHDGDGLDPAEHQYPVAYKRGSNPIIQARIYLEKLTEFVSFRIKANGPWSFLVNPTGANTRNEPNGPGQYVEAIALASANALPNKVDYLEEWSISWSIQPEDEPWVTAGQSQNQAYLTLDVPVVPASETPIPAYHTLIHLGSAIAKDETSSDGVVAKVFGHMAGLEVDAVNDGRLWYYKKWRNGIIDTTQLIARLDGQCGAWANLFFEVLALQGVKSETVAVLPVPVDAKKPGDTLLVINNWDPPAQQSGVLFYIGSTPWKEGGGNGYDLTPQSTLTDANGINGQGINTNPESLFSDHVMVRYKNKFYDASYGKLYDSIQDFEESLRGYGIVDTQFSSIVITKTLNGLRSPKAIRTTLSQ